MKTYKNITIVGTSHISIESIREVEYAIDRLKPDLIALELDKMRLGALFIKKRKISLSDIKRLGIRGFLFNLIGSYVEKRLGKIVNVKPGSEMKKAIELARENKIKIALIDQEISITLKKLSNSITLREKLNFLIDLIMSLFKKEKIDFDLEKVPSKETIEKLTRRFKKNYPSVYKVIVEERNMHMAKNLYMLMQQYNNIVAIVGAGHEDDLIKEVKLWESSAKKRQNTT